MSYVCHFVLVFFSPFSIAITSLGEERANLSAFRTFVRFVLVWICRFPLPLDVWEGLRFVIMALPGLFSYLFLFITHELTDKRGRKYPRARPPILSMIYLSLIKNVCDGCKPSRSCTDLPHLYTGSQDYVETLCLDSLCRLY